MGLASLGFDPEPSSPRAAIMDLRYHSDTFCSWTFDPPACGLIGQSNMSLDLASRRVEHLSKLPAAPRRVHAVDEMSDLKHRILLARLVLAQWQIVAGRPGTVHLISIAEGQEDARTFLHRLRVDNHQFAPHFL